MSVIKMQFEKNKLIMIAVLAFLVISMTFIGYQIYFNNQLAPVNSSDKSYLDIVIPESSNARQVAAILKQNNLIHSESVFLGYCRRNKWDNQLKAGHYRFSRSQSVKKIARAISTGQAIGTTVTIPEGYTVNQIGELLVNKHICTKEQWEMALQKNYNFEFLKNVPGGTNRLEGFLFPDTYFLDEGITAEKTITMMLKNFQTVWNNNFLIEANNKNLNLYDTIIIASMIEREAKVAGERKVISGVIYNRLDKNMPLQIDATVIYALGEHRKVVTNQDLKVDSPYNTYKYSGLPYGPIANPGKASIEAAINPQKHNYYYYVCKGNGSHYFAKTYAEHLKAKQIYIK